MKCALQALSTLDCPSLTACLCSLWIYQLFLKIQARAQQSLSKAFWLNMSRKDPSATMSGYFYLALRIMWKRAIDPHAFMACCFMQNTFLGTSSGLRLSASVFLKAVWAGDSSQSIIIPSTGLGTISNPHSSRDSSSWNEKRSVFRPSLEIYPLITSGLLSRGIQFCSCPACPYISNKELLILQKLQNKALRRRRKR